MNYFDPNTISAVADWNGYGLLGTLLGAVSVIFAGLASARAKSARDLSRKAVSLVSAFDAVADLGRVREYLNSARVALRGGDWSRLVDACDNADMELTRLLSSVKLALSEKSKRKLESVLEIVRSMSQEADAAEDRNTQVDSLKGKAQIKKAMGHVIALQEEMKGHEDNE